MNRLLQIWHNTDLRKRIGLTIGLLFVERVMAHIPLPGADLDKLKEFFAASQIFGLLNLFSGGTLSNFSLALMGIGPYITASIVIQLLSTLVPSLAALKKDGQHGQQKINQYTRYATIPLALIQIFAVIQTLKTQGILTSYDPLTILTLVLAATAGTVFLMWLGELITESGIGNGASLIITVGIIAGIPGQLRNTLALLTVGGIETGQIIASLGWLALSLAIIALIVLTNEAERRIPVTYARRVRAVSESGSVQSHLPLKLNLGGVLPIIFALTFLVIPEVAGRFFSTLEPAWLIKLGESILKFVSNRWLYGSVYFALVIAFTYFYTYLIFQPKEIAENLQKQGGFVPGIRPGVDTEHYLMSVINRITLTGSLFLAIVALLPYIIENITGIQSLAISGTSILIMVSVTLETMRQIQAYLLQNRYEQY